MENVKKYLTSRMEELVKTIDDKDISEEAVATAIGNLAIVTEMYSRTTERVTKIEYFMIIKIMLRQNIEIIEREYASITGETKTAFKSSMRFRWLNGKVLEIINFLDNSNVEHGHISTHYTGRFCS